MQHRNVILHGINQDITICGIWIRFVFWQAILKAANASTIVKKSVNYMKKVGSKSPIHRYHVLEAGLPSTTIIAHLYKDGNRFIHYDSKQCRSITVREAARLQSFDDDFDFIGTQGNAYQMIGNAVPPKLAKAVSFAVADLLGEMEV